jgi:hypothetical protein
VTIRKRRVHGIRDCPEIAWRIDGVDALLVAVRSTVMVRLWVTAPCQVRVATPHLAVHDCGADRLLGTPVGGVDAGEVGE